VSEIKRVALMGFMLESNTFAPVSDEDAFRSLCYMAGTEILDDIAKDNASLPIEIPSFCNGMDCSGISWQPMPIVVTAAEPGGPVDQVFFERTKNDMETRLRAAMPLDGVYIAEHGAMTGTGSHDPDGDLFEMVRGVVGPGVPIMATLDLHANISEKMVESTDVLISYLTNPHVDQKESAEKACALMIEMWGGMKPQTAFIRLPLVAPSVTLLTAEGPYADLINLGQEKLTKDIANVSVVAGFVYGDTPMNGIAVIVTGRNDLAPAKKLCADIAEQGWRDRQRFQINLTSLDGAVSKMAMNGEDPARPAQIFADVADNPGGGGRGNTTWILKTLVEHKVDGVFFSNFFDPTLAAKSHAAGVGATFVAVFNEETESQYSEQFDSPVTVLAINDGKCIGRRGIWAGRALNLGPSALLQVGGVKLVVGSMRKQGADPIWLEMFGLDIADARSVVVKSRGHFRAGYDEYFTPDRVFEVDVPGLTSPVLSNFDFKGLPRPVYPLDEETTWDSPFW
jgi:microcystin degradation protein MlrC